MKAIKAMPDLLEDLFTFFQKKYGKGGPYESHQHSSSYAKVVPLNIPHCPEWAHLALILEQYRFSKNHASLMLTASIPPSGHNENFPGKLLEVQSSFKGKNALWITPTDTIGDISHVISFNNKEDKPIYDLRFEVMLKASDLYCSGIYNTERFRFEEKITA